MIEKATYNKLIAYLKKLAEDEQEHLSNTKSAMSRVPLEVGPSIEQFLYQHRVPRHKNADLIKYLAEKGIIVKHPWGGWMLPQPADADIPPVEEAERIIEDIVKELKENSK